MKQSPLSRVENIIRRVMEEPFTWFGSGSLDPFQLAAYLSRSYEEQVTNGESPNQFTIYINPADDRILRQTMPGIEKQLGDYVVLMTERRGIHLSETPRVRLEIDPEVKERSARIVLDYDQDNGPVETAVYQAESGDPTQEAIRAADAFLMYAMFVSRPVPPENFTRDRIEGESLAIATASRKRIDACSRSTAAEYTSARRSTGESAISILRPRPAACGDFPEPLPVSMNAVRNRRRCVS